MASGSRSIHCRSRRDGMPNRPRTRTDVSTIPGTASPAITGTGHASSRSCVRRGSLARRTMRSRSQSRKSTPASSRVSCMARTPMRRSACPHYAVVTDKGEILDSSKNPYETAVQAKSRAEVQEHVWNSCGDGASSISPRCSPRSVSPPSPSSTRRKPNSPAERLSGNKPL